MRDSIVRVAAAAWIGVAVVVVGMLGWHLWSDHQAYHNNMQLLGAVRAAVVEMHPELVEKAQKENR